MQLYKTTFLIERLHHNSKRLWNYIFVFLNNIVLTYRALMVFFRGTQFLDAFCLKNNIKKNWNSYFWKSCITVAHIYLILFNWSSYLDPFFGSYFVIINVTIEIFIKTLVLLYFFGEILFYYYIISNKKSFQSKFLSTKKL